MPVMLAASKGLSGHIRYSCTALAGWSVPPVAKFEDMIAIELAAMRDADVLVHLNDEEAAIFKTLAPQQRHELLYPAVAPVAPGRGGDDLIIVASANISGESAAVIGTNSICRAGNSQSA